MPTHGLILDGYRPTSTNKLTSSHWRVKHRLKTQDARLIAIFAKLQQIPKATGKRRVSLRIVLSGRQQPLDPDNVWKVLLDSLVKCELLKDDSDKWLELGPVRWERGGRTRTEVVLEDIGDVAQP